MKKWIAFCLLVVSLCGLSGCGETAAYTAGVLDLVEQAGAFSEELEELDPDTAFMVYRLGDYGLAVEDLIECAVLRSSGATCEEGVVLVWTSKEMAEKALKALGDYVEGQIEANRNYRPGEISKLEDARLEQMGNSAVLIVAESQNVVSDVFSKIG